MELSIENKMKHDLQSFTSNPNNIIQFDPESDISFLNQLLYLKK